MESVRPEMESVRPEMESVRRELAWRDYGRAYEDAVAAKTAHSGTGRDELDDERDLVSSSDLFDRDWYLSQYPDVAASGVDPARHFLSRGGGEGRDPGPGFDARSYVLQYPDVAAAGVNALVHYLRSGRAEGRSIRVSSVTGSTQGGDPAGGEDD
jgi:hypothetical protein